MDLDEILSLETSHFFLFVKFSLLCLLVDD
jgi:hypothetical protein